MTEAALRLADLDSDGHLPSDLDDTRICYWRSPGCWWIYLPRGGAGRLVDHDVVEHEDGTITVSPSIGMARSEGGYVRHGFFRRGVWEPCGDDR